MKFKFASLAFFVLSGVATPAFAQWSYRIDPAADSNYQCISPSGEIVSGWRSCHADGVCNNAPAVNKLCETTYGTPVPATVVVPVIAQWDYRINPAADHEYQCISPSGEYVGGWYSCHSDDVCNSAPAVKNKCEIRFGITSAVFGGSDLTVIKVKLDQVMQPASLTSVVHDCTTNPACKFALDAAAAYVGVDSSLITSAVAQIQKSRNGEDGDFHYILPAGYQYCRAMVETVSVVPKTGDKASLMSITGSNRDVRVQTWTPRLGLLDGKSWVEANFTIVGVRDKLAQQYRSNGVCKDKYLRAVCRGGSGINNGSPACGVITD